MRIPPTLFFLLVCVAALVVADVYAQPEQGSGRMDVSSVLQWEYLVVSTPMFLGPPKMDSVEYQPPVAILISMPENLPCQTNELMGVFEAKIQLNGRVGGARYYPPSGAANRTQATSCQLQHVIPLINSWQFKPATYVDKPIEVIIRVMLQPK